MKKYEIMYILTANLEEEARKDAMSKLQTLLEDNGAKVTDTKELGLKDLAYQIKKQSKGYYVVIKVATDGDLNEFNRLTKLNANVLRYLVIEDQD